MPSWEISNSRSPAYRESVLPSIVSARVSVELGATLAGNVTRGTQGQMIGMSPSSVLRLPGRTLQKGLDLRLETVVAEPRRRLPPRSR